VPEIMADEQVNANQGGSVGAYVEAQVRQHGYMKVKRQPYEPLWRTACGIFAPELTDNVSAAGLRFGADIYDGYPALALQTWANGIVGNMIYPESRWLNIVLNVRKLMDDDDVKAYLQERSEQTFYAASRTNLYEVNPPAAIHAGVMGAYLIPMIDRTKRSIHYYLEDPWKVWVEVDVFGNVIRLHREITKTVQAWADVFGKTALAKDWQARLADQGNPLTEVTVLHCIFKNPDYDQASVRADARRWASVYIDPANKHLISKSGLNYGPIAWQVYRHPGWIYPVTPAMRCLTDAFSNDVLSEGLFATARQAMDPEMRVSKDLRAIYEKGPGGVTYLDNPEQVVEQVRKRLDYSVAAADRQHFTNNVDRWFAVDFFMLLSRITGQPPTAFHIQQLQGEKVTLLGPQVGSYERRLLVPSVDVLLTEEPNMTGESIEPPDVLVDFLRDRFVADMTGIYQRPTEETWRHWLDSNPVLETQFTGLLTQIQSTLMANRGYATSLDFIDAISKQWPAAKYIVDEFQFTRHALEAQNLSHDDLRSEDEYKKVIEQLQQQEALAQQAEMGEAVARQYQAMRGAPEQGSPMESIA
jgi:hypothetical protein